MPDADPRPWSNAEKRWLLLCVKQAELDKPTDEFGFGKVLNGVHLYLDFLRRSERFGHRSIDEVKSQVCDIRKEVETIARKAPVDLRMLNDSYQLIQWVLMDAEPYPVTMKELDEGDRYHQDFQERYYRYKNYINTEGWTIIPRIWYRSDACAYDKWSRLTVMHYHLKAMACEFEEAVKEIEQPKGSSKTTM
ncbi:hypothetical protein PG993_011421 [Apiospora rasikravindrae]|uniref:Uncharacterized protein n=1 Tax=Apiospora rasikravindrae TaxID=990691 RepID=A0ABR1SE90_9PEZI